MSAMSARFPTEADPLAVASADVLAPVETIRFTETALERVEDPTRHHKALDVSALDGDASAEDSHARDLVDQEEREDGENRENVDEREERENAEDRDEHAVKPDHTDGQDGAVGQEPQDASDKPEHVQPDAQESAHVTLVHQVEAEHSDQVQPDGAAVEHEHHHQAVLAEHLEGHVDVVSTAQLTVLMPQHAQPLPPPPPMQPSPPQQPLKKKRKTYNTEEERRKARILKNRRTAEESRQRRMKRMKELEEYVASSAIREKDLQEEARLAKVQLAAVRESMEQLVAQKEAEIATKDTEIQRLRDELSSR